MRATTTSMWALTVDSSSTTCLRAPRLLSGRLSSSLRSKVEFSLAQTGFVIGSGMRFGNANVLNKQCLKLAILYLILPQRKSVQQLAAVAAHKKLLALVDGKFTELYKLLYTNLTLL